MPGNVSASQLCCVMKVFSLLVLIELNLTSIFRSDLIKIIKPWTWTVHDTHNKSNSINIRDKPSIMFMFINILLFIDDATTAHSAIQR